MAITSYAQNFEDVLLWRALGHIEGGFYVDVGAQHPVIDSISRAFYERGWRGVHVEPTVFYADLLRDDRPDELVIQAAIAEQRGLLSFFEIPDTGLSTASPKVAEHHREQGYAVRNTTVTALTLDDLFGRVETDIHWLKIDVEGFEMEVLSGWRESPRRPWVVVVESTYPNSQQETHQEWEALVLVKGYAFAHFDGLNRYYVSDLHPELKDAFRFGPNVFDGFQIAESSWSAGVIKQRYGEKLEAEAQQRTKVEHQLAAVSETLARAEAEWAQREHALREDTEKRIEVVRAEAQSHVQQVSERGIAFARELAQAQRDAQQAATDELRVHAEREQALQAELAALREALAGAETAAGDRERKVFEEAEQKLDAARAEARSQLQQMLARERAFTEQLAQAQREAKEVLEEQVRGHVGREQALQAQLASLGEALSRVRQEAADGERRLSGLIQQTLQDARNDAQAHRREFIERERAFSGQLAQAQHESQQAFKEQNRAHAEREKVLQRELTQSREEAQSQMQQLIARERAINELSQVHQIAVDVERELRRALFAQNETRQALQLQLAERDHQINAARSLEAALRAHLAQEAERAAHFAAELGEMRHTLSWRLTAPVRRLIGRAAGRGLRPAEYSPTTQTVALAWCAPGHSEELSPGLQPAEAVANARHPPPVTFPAAPPIPSVERETTRRPFMATILHVDELLELHDATFVVAAYQALLWRTPDAEGMRFYVARIRSGISKIQILAEMRKSPEGRSRSSEIIGLDDSIWHHAWLAVPVLGTLLRTLGFGKKEPPTLQRLRVLENQLNALSERLQNRSVPVQETAGSPVEAHGPHIRAVTPHAREIYRQLKIAAANRERGK